MAKTMMFNPYTGTPRHPSDIASDPAGLLILDDGEPLRAAPAQAQQAAKPLAWLKHYPGALKPATVPGCTFLPEDALAMGWEPLGRMTATKAEAKPLTDEQIEALRRIEDFPTFGLIVRIAERACAEAWGVKLAGIGASSGGGGEVSQPHA